MKRIRTCAHCNQHDTVLGAPCQACLTQGHTVPQVKCQACLKARTVQGKKNMKLACQGKEVPFE